MAICRVPRVGETGKVLVNRGFRVCLAAPVVSCPKLLTADRFALSGRPAKVAAPAMNRSGRSGIIKLHVIVLGEDPD